jgi:ADP-heptose:LPS heptosyltransferase
MKLRSRGRFNVKRWTRLLAERVRGNEFERALRTARRRGSHAYVFCWNRGLGDVALGLVPLFARIRAQDADSRIIVFTRAELAEIFMLAGVDELHAVAELTRGAPIDPHAAAAQAGVVLTPSATVFADPDPTQWLDGRRQDNCPSLQWDPAWNARADRLLPADSREIVIGAHVSSETAQYYGYAKDWPASAWESLLARFPASRNVRWLLFGNTATTLFKQSNVDDLRGRTTLLDLLAVIRTRCRVLVAPDSGILTAAFYLAEDFPLSIVSLWSDPRQGILKQGCPSPNRGLHHKALQGRDEDVRNLPVDDVERAVAEALERSSRSPNPVVAHAIAP